MGSPRMIGYQEVFNRIRIVTDQLVTDSNAKAVFVFGKKWQVILPPSGDLNDLDSSSFSSLTSSANSLRNDMLRLLKEDRFATLFEQGERTHLYLQFVGRRVLLAVFFGAGSSLGLVRYHARLASGQLTRIFEDMLPKANDLGSDSPLAEFTDAGIDDLFAD